MDLGWLVRKWKLAVLLPMLVYVFSIPASLIAYAVHDLAMTVAILENALWVSLALGIALFVLFIVLGIARPIRDAPRVGLRHVYLFVVLFMALVLALFALVLHAPPTLAEAYFILTTLNFSFSLIGSGLVVAGLHLHNLLAGTFKSIVLRPRDCDWDCNHHADADNGTATTALTHGILCGIHEGIHENRTDCHHHRASHSTTARGCTHNHLHSPQEEKEAKTTSIGLLPILCGD